MIYYVDMATNYIPLKDYPEGITTTSTPLNQQLADDSDRYGPASRRVAHGRPCTKSRCDRIDLLALACSFLCLIICIVVITPSQSYAWRLGYNNQLIVIGFMLAIMNLCSRRIATRLFVIFEARWGSSTLQNFDAILRQSVFVPQTSIFWVSTFLVLTMLPLGLSIAYKSFNNGSASQLITNISIKQYGFFNRPYTRDQIVVTPSAKSSMQSFLTAASSDKIGPTYAKNPQPFGFNQLLISNTTCAVLDMPNSTILATIQEGLELGESLTISADVKGTVAVYNTSTQTLLQDDQLWSNLWELHTLETYANYRMGLSFSSYVLDAFVWVGGYFQTCGNLPAYTLCNYWYEHYNKVDAKDVTAFRESNMTMLFNIYRQRCSATWNVTASDVSLIEGACDEVSEPNRLQNTDGNMMPVMGDLMDVLYPSIASFLPNRADSAWRVPSYAMLSATAYWVRWALYGMTEYGNSQLRDSRHQYLKKEMVYELPGEKIVSTRLTLAARPGLYIVLAIQPILTTLFFILTICFYSTPIDSGFGVTSILASVEKDSLDHLRGAGLSGQLSRRLHLNISVEDSVETKRDHSHGLIRSRIGLFKESRRARLRSGEVYG